MPWTSADASGFTKKATTETLQKLWAKTANRILKKTGDEGKAIRVANATVAVVAKRGKD
jgi:hypothetical protein